MTVAMNPARGFAGDTVRRRLLALLLPPLVLLLAAGVVLDYGNGIAPLRQAHDQALANTALALAARVYGRPGELGIDRPEQALAPLTPGIDGYRNYFHVRSAVDGADLGERDLPSAAAGGDGFGYRDARHHGERVRLVSYYGDSPAGPLVVTVAETRHKHDAASLRILGSLVLTDLLQLAATVLLVWFGVSHGLRPLLRLRDEIARRSPSELAPLDASAAPGEVRPVVAELNRLFATVRETALSQQQFLADAAHQIRTPLAGLRTRLELMLRTAQTPSLRDDLEALQHSVGRLAHTTHQLLALARAEPAAHLSIAFDRVDLRALTEDVVEREFDHALACGRDLGVEVESAVTNGVAWLLRELLGNLLDNAIRYSGNGGRITARCGMRADAAYLEVEDDGPGIPEHARSRVRERFYRLPGTTAAGCGLGLAIVDEVARLHGATLRIADARRGKGTLVRIDFAPPEARRTGRVQESS